MNKSQCLLFFFLLMTGQAVLGENDAPSSETECIIRYPQSESAFDSRYRYPIELLVAALRITEDQYPACIAQPNGILSQKRKIRELETKGVIDIAWLPATNALDLRLKSIHIPLRKGLLGWRVLLIRDEDKEKFAAVENIDQLDQFSAGFEFDWQDLPVMEHNFNTVIKGSTYEELFKMLSYGRFDFFSRALHEAWDELETRKTIYPNLIVEDTIVLHYKQVDYFYVNKTDTNLYDRIALGLNRLITNGEFNKVFYRYYSKDIVRANIPSRKVINLKNPNLPDNVPLEDPQLWFQLMDLPLLKQHQGSYE